MHRRSKWISIAFSALIISGFPIGNTSFAAEEWVASEVSRSLPGQEDVSAQTYFSPRFSKLHGKFRAQYDSMLDKRTTTEGDFLVARFRYQYKKPIGTPGSKVSPFHDEYVSEVLLDCRQNFSGTAAEIFFLKGKEVLALETPKSDILMIQMEMPGTTIDDLCAFAKKRGAW